MGHYLFILESIGTPELILIAVVALIIFGPRKLPQIGRTIGKYTSEFKRASQDFRQTWEREVQMAEYEEPTGTREPNLAKLEELAEQPAGSAVENTIGRSSARRTSVENTEEIAALNENGSVALPEIRAVAQDDFALEKNGSVNHHENASETTQLTEVQPARKRDWL